MPRPRRSAPPEQPGPGLGAEREDALFTNLLALALALAETLALYLAAALAFGVSPLDGILGRAPDDGLPWFAAVLLSRGLLQPLNVCLFGFGANLLVFRLWSTRREFAAFRHPYLAGIPAGADGDAVIGEEARRVPLENVRRIADESTGTPPLLVRRLEAGSRRLAEEGDAGQVHAVLQAVAAIDREVVEGRYTLIRYLTWLIPTIGFLGTVIGIGRAIAGFSAVMASVGAAGGDLSAQLQPLLRSVAHDLGIAFDTTVLALLLSALIVALASVTQSRDEELLSSVDDFTVRRFVSRIAVPDYGTKQLGQMLQGALIGIGQALASGAGKPDGEGEYGLRDLAGQLSAQRDHLGKIAQLLEEIRAALERRGS